MRTGEHLYNRSKDRKNGRMLIIPVFVPHMGCPHDCVFCNQRSISCLLYTSGLGNIGPEYDGTRHNCGFMAVDLLAAQYGIAVTKKKAKGTLGEGKIAGHDVVLVKPDTYMNLSGVCIRGVLDWYKMCIRDSKSDAGRGSPADCPDREIFESFECQY